MNSGTIAIVVGFGVLVAVTIIPLHLARDRRKAGPRGQLEFRRVHGATVRRLLGEGAPTSVVHPRSPWMDVMVGGRHARMVAAPIAPGVVQAGIELLDWTFADGVQIWHTSGAEDELEAPADGQVDIAELERIAAQLREHGVDSLASPGAGAPHVLRIRFDDVPDLARRLGRVAGLLERLTAH